MRTRLWLNLAVQAVLLVGIILVFDHTDWDLRVQEWFFDRATGEWMFPDEGGAARAVFYVGARRLITAFGLACLTGWIATRFVASARRHRRFFALMTLALICIPSTVSLLKRVSNVHFPSRVVEFGGKKPHVGVLEPVPDWYQGKPGKGWPAGHASAGFALLMLGLAWRDPRRRIAGFAIGLTAGWSMGWFQVAAGAHFLSHNLVTQSIALMEITALAAAYDHLARRSPASDAHSDPTPAAAPLPGSS